MAAGGERTEDFVFRSPPSSAGAGRGGSRSSSKMCVDDLIGPTSRQRRQRVSGRKDGQKMDKTDRNE